MASNNSDEEISKLKAEVDRVIQEGETHLLHFHSVYGCLAPVTMDQDDRLPCVSMAGWMHKRITENCLRMGSSSNDCKLFTTHRLRSLSQEHPYWLSVNAATLDGQPPAHATTSN